MIEPKRRRGPPLGYVNLHIIEMASRPQGVRFSDVIKFVLNEGLSENSVGERLSNLVKTGHLTRIALGHYVAPRGYGVAPDERVRAPLPKTVSRLYPEEIAEALYEAATAWVPGEPRIDRINQLTDRLVGMGLARPRSATGMFWPNVREVQA